MSQAKATPSEPEGQFRGVCPHDCPDKSTGGRNVNWTTPDTLADFAGQSTFHTNRVWIRKVSEN